MFKFSSLIMLILLFSCGQQNMNTKKTTTTITASALTINSIVGKKYYVVSNGFTCAPYGPVGATNSITRNWSDKIEFTMDNNQISVILYGGPCNDAFGAAPFDANIFHVSADQQSVTYQGKTFALKPNDMF